MFALDQEVYVKSTGELGIIVDIYHETNSVELWYYDGTYDERKFDDIIGSDNTQKSND
ncbi:hypothetical protein [Bacillus velezensis]|uniref:hypothetical protein n=1 Tax=Bacillus velezensis TaxID=492670 RepID=UPI00214D443D|nr:hypothetical protein [Bacillus velezensis]